jgi:hypothetical protein
MKMVIPLGGAGTVEEGAGAMHSLGAALATLAADRLPGVQEVYTFGSPRVGNAAFSRGFTDRAYREVNDADIVSKLPPGKRYAHVGEKWLIDGSGKLRRGPDPTDPEARVEPESASRDFLGAFRDHIPIFYATRIRSAIQDAGISRPVISHRRP